MAIGENNVTLDRQDLSTIDASGFAGAVGAENNSAFVETTQGWTSPFTYGDIETDITAESFAGISENFVTNLHTAIDDYIGKISAKLEELETNVAVDAAFKGTEVESSLKTLTVLL